MNSPFFETSKEIANHFLQSIVFVDDRAFESAAGKGDHDFDAYLVTKAFAEKQKICAVYKPKTADDINHLAQLAKKADITVLDWQINLGDEPVPEGKEEEDADEVDPRGPHTLKIINEIISDPVTGLGTLKLILVYTGEIALQDITNEIYKSLEIAKLPGLNKGFCEVYTDNVKVIVIAKPNASDQDNEELKFKHNQELNARIKKYEELPDFILDEFSKMTSGLLSNFVLKSLTIIKNNTYKLIQLHNKELDTSFLSHRLLLVNQDDATEQIIEVFADSIRALLQYNDSKESLSSVNIQKWIDTQNFSKDIEISGKPLKMNNDFVKKWVESDFECAASQEWIKAGYGEVTEDKKNAFSKRISTLAKLSTPLLLTEDNINVRDVEYSILTHHKSVFKPHNVLPKLTLGAVVKGDKTGYWVCIQQRCDSVRLDDVRRFLFLPLEVSDKLFHFITNDNIKLKLKKKSFNLRTIKFLDLTGEGIIKAINNKGSLVFEPYYKNGHDDYQAEKDEVYEWIMDLKDLHAQRIAQEFATEISRVGLDESEWLRRRYS